MIYVRTYEFIQMYKPQSFSGIRCIILGQYLANTICTTDRSLISTSHHSSGACLAVTSVEYSDLSGTLAAAHYSSIEDDSGTEDEKMITH